VIGRIFVAGIVVDKERLGAIDGFGQDDGEEDTAVLMK
jgi:hypothetical protein